MQQASTSAFYDAGRAWINANARALHLIPVNARTFHTQKIANGLAVHPTLGMALATNPVTGHVVHVADSFSVLKTDRTSFAIVDNTILEQPLVPKCNVTITPYVARDFDGIPLNQLSLKDRKEAPNARMFGMRRPSIPVKPTTAYMEILIEQLNALPMPDKMRCVSVALVDAGARKETLQLVEERSTRTYSLSMSVSTAKHQGTVCIGYDEKFDLYWIELTDLKQQLVKRFDDVYFDVLPEVLEDNVTDTACLLAKVQLQQGGRAAKAA